MLQQKGLSAPQQAQQKLRSTPAAHGPYVRPKRVGRSATLRVAALLEKDLPTVSKETLDSLERALLPPSLQTVETRSSSPPQVLTSLQDQVFYFAYGANLHLQTLKRRGLNPPHSRSPAVVVDPSVKLMFKHRGGFSTLQQLQPGQQAKYTPYLPHVHGVLYQLDKQDLPKLTKKEGGYKLVDIEVETYDGWRATGKTFVSGPLAQLQAEVVPTERYMKLLRDGAADNYLDPLYQAWLSSIETVPSVGLPPEYWDTPAKYIAYSFLGIVALLVVGFFAQH